LEIEMDLFLGVGILAASYVLFCCAYAAHRGQPRAAWPDWPGASMLVCVALTTLFPIGLGFLIKGLFGIGELTTAALVPAAVTGVFALLAALGGRWLMRADRFAGATVPTAVNSNSAPAQATRPRAA
jgi:hypothetical protein